MEAGGASASRGAHHQPAGSGADAGVAGSDRLLTIDSRQEVKAVVYFMQERVGPVNFGREKSRRFTE